MMKKWSGREFTQFVMLVLTLLMIVPSASAAVFAQQDWDFTSAQQMRNSPSMEGSGDAGGLGESRPVTLSTPGPWGGTKVLENYFGVVPADWQPQVSTNWYFPGTKTELWIETWIRFDNSWEIGPGNPNYPPDGNVDHKTFFLWEIGGGQWRRWEFKFGPNWNDCVASAAEHDIMYAYWTFPDSRGKCQASRDIWDGQWHQVRLHAKQGSGDGLFRIWWDGALVVDRRNLDTKSTYPFKGITFGGNRNQGTNQPMFFQYGPATLWDSQPNWDTSYTPPPPSQDTTPPVVSGQNPTGILTSATTSVTFRVNTNEVSTCKYATSSGQSYTNKPNTFSSTGGTTHTSTVSGLSAGSYTYYVRCQDSSNNANTQDTMISFSIPQVQTQCTDTQTRPCPNGLSLGSCSAGIQTCQSGSWGSCVGAVGPTFEGSACDGVDNDCDGSTDEDLSCVDPLDPLDPPARNLGDANADGKVSIADLTLVAQNYGVANFDSRADLNGNGVVDLFDLVEVSTAYGIVYEPPVAASSDCSVAGTNVFNYCYFSGISLTDSIQSGSTPSINFDWGAVSPSGVPVDSFSARYRGNFQFQSGTYEFRATVDDGVRVYVDGTVVIDSWSDQAATLYVGSIDLSAGMHEVVVEYYENDGRASLIIDWMLLDGQSPVDR